MEKIEELPESIHIDLKSFIEKLNDEHHSTKFPIVYTSADSVFQIAVDTDMIPLETLYDWCEKARKILFFAAQFRNLGESFANALIIFRHMGKRTGRAVLDAVLGIAEIAPAFLP